MTMSTKFALGLGGVLLLVTLASFVPSNWWLIQALNLIREPAAYAITALMLVALALSGKGHRGKIAALYGITALINIACIWPYSRFAATELSLVENVSPERCFTAMAANVLMENDDFERLIRQVEAVDPDVLLLTETDAEWIKQLEPLTSRYTYIRAHPQEDTFGKVFASRIPVVDTDIVEKAGEDTPTVYAYLQTSETELIRFIGLHPRAPLPGQNTQQRDRSILRAADNPDTKIAGSIVMGDFNDVPWSETTQSFREKGEWLDPRVGRGTYPTFPSDILLLGWPLDQIMVNGEIGVAGFSVLEDNGSDHRAISGEFCLDRSINKTEDRDE